MISKENVEKAIQLITDMTAIRIHNGDADPVSSDKINSIQFNKLMWPEFIKEFKHNRISALALKCNDKNGNFYVCVHDNDVEKAKNLFSKIYQSYSYAPVTPDELNRINKNRENSQTCTINNLSDYEFSALQSAFMNSGLTFAAKIESDGYHEIGFMSSDYETARKAITYAAKDISESKDEKISFHIANKVFNDIESNLKNKETVYICDKTLPVYLKIEPERWTLLSADNKVLKESIAEKSVLTDSEVWNELSLTVVNYFNPAALSEQEFKDIDRDKIIQEKLDNYITDFVDFPPNAEEIIKQINANLTVPENIRNDRIEELE